MRAEQAGCSISQMIRIVLFSDVDDVAGAASSVEKKRLQALQRVRDEFKKIGVEYKQTVDKILSGNDMNPAQTERLLRDLEDLTIELQRSVNTVLINDNLKETHSISRSIPARKSDEKAVKKVQEQVQKLKNFKLKYCYMECITIVGFLPADAEEYEKKGTKKMRFSVYCERYRKEGKKRVSYSVFASRDGRFDFLKKGRQVTVIGTFDEGEKGEKIIFADSIALMGES